jgi:hypothetical protein
MAKCVITFEDDADGIVVKGHLEPAVDSSNTPTEAQRVGWTFFKSIQAALDIPDTEVQDAPKESGTEKS